MTVCLATSLRDTVAPLREGWEGCLISAPLGFFSFGFSVFGGMLKGLSSRCILKPKRVYPGRRDISVGSFGVFVGVSVFLATSFTAFTDSVAVAEMKL